MRSLTPSNGPGQFRRRNVVDEGIEAAGRVYGEIGLRRCLDAAVAPVLARSCGRRGRWCRGRLVAELPWAFGAT